MIRGKSGLWLALAIGVTGVTGCGLFGSSGPAAAAPVEVSLVAGDRLNPDEQGQSLPTAVRIYQLKAGARLESADADRVYREPKEALGEDLLAVEEVTISPGEKVTRTLEREPAARVLAVVALFRRPAAVSWRVLTDLPPASKGTKASFALEGYRIERR
jgi:type VI secretion system protein VasD